MRRRISHPIITFLLLGIASTYAVAWSLSILASHQSPANFPIPFDLEEHDQRGHIVFCSLWRYSPGVLVTSWSFARIELDRPGLDPFPYRLIEPHLFWQLPSIHDQHTRRSTELISDRIPACVDWWAGWPKPALHGSLPHDSLAEPSPVQCRNGTLRFRDNVSRVPIGDQVWLTGHLFPLIPVWPGFAINSVFYAAIWFLLIARLRATRGWLRQRHNHCPTCNYDLHALPANTPCPECGNKRSPAPQ